MYSNIYMYLYIYICIYICTLQHIVDEKSVTLCIFELLNMD